MHSALNHPFTIDTGSTEASYHVTHAVVAMHAEAETCLVVESVKECAPVPPLTSCSQMAVLSAAALDDAMHVLC